MSASDDMAGDDSEIEDEFERHTKALHELIDEYLDAEDIPESVGAVLLLGVALHKRMVGYAIEVEKPSASGLKLDMDRFRRDVEVAFRDAKKGAEDFIAEIKPVLAAERLADQAKDLDDGGEEP